MAGFFFCIYMPLLKGKKNIGKNIKTEMAVGKPRKQAIAIALSEAGMSKKKKKKVAKRTVPAMPMTAMEKRLGMVQA